MVRWANQEDITLETIGTRGSLFLWKPEAVFPVLVGKFPVLSLGHLSMDYCVLSYESESSIGMAVALATRA